MEYFFFLRFGDLKNESHFLKKATFKKKSPCNSLPKGGFFSESAIRFFKSPKLKKKFQKTILSLKFKFPANNTLLLLTGNLNFKFRIVFWNIFFWRFEKHIAKKATFTKACLFTYIWEIVLLKHQTRKQFMEFWKDQPHFYTFCSLFIHSLLSTLDNSFRFIYSCPSLLWIGITMLGCVFKALIPPIVFINCRQHW